MDTSYTGLNILLTSWGEVRLLIKKINPTLFEIIERLNPGENLSLIKASYPFGSIIVNNGIVYLPRDNNTCVSLLDPSLNSALKDKLGYSAIPLGLLLNKASEVFVTTVDKRVIPLKLIEPGKFFGLFETVDHMLGYHFSPIWSVASGSRSIFMLPKITETTKFNKLKKEFNLKSEKPNHLSDHWRIFTELAHSNTDEKNQWYSEVLFFTSDWFKQKNDNNEWLRFYQYLQSDAWLHSQQGRDETAFGLLMLRFSSALTNRNFYPRPYIMDSIRHLINIARGSIPGFKPADDSQVVAPTNFLQDIYVNIYGLTEYIPTLMHPYNFIYKKSGSLYHSLYLSTVLESTPNDRNAPTLISDERDIKKFMGMFTSIIRSDVSRSEQNMVDPNVTFDYFHVDKDIYAEIKTSDSIPIQDKRFIENKYNNNLKFCSTSPYWRGAISISYINL